MQVSDIFIRRPVFAVVVSLLLMVGGLAALLQMPVREYPAVDPPIVSVSTVYKGASNEVIESRVTELIEGSVAGIEGIRQVSSQSQNERSSVTIEFYVGRDPDAAAADVRDRVSRILARLPDGVDPPVVSKVDANAQAILWIGVTSTTLDSLELTEFMKRVYVDRLSTVPGVANVIIGGERRYAMRIWIDRAALAARGLTVQDVETAVKRQNVELPGGLITSPKRELTVKTNSASPPRKNSRKSSSPARTAILSGSARSPGSRSARRTTASSSTRTARPPSGSASCANRPPTRSPSRTACAPSWSG